MSFTVFPASVAWSLIVAVAALITGLYLLKQRRRRVMVASNYLWRMVASKQTVRSETRRWLLSLLLALAVGLSAVLALMGLSLSAADGGATRLVLILDNSASMSALRGDGRTRWQHAVARARDLIESAPAQSVYLVADTMADAAIAGFVDRPSALHELQNMAPIAVGHARIPPTVPVDRHTEIHFLTDGVAGLSVGADVHVESVFEPATDAGISAFAVRAAPGAPSRMEAFVQVFNASLVEKRVTLELNGAGFSVHRELQVPAGGSNDQTVDVTDSGAGVLRARVRMAGDAFELDDLAYAVVPEHAVRRVVLVTPGNPYLEEALRLLPDIRLTVQRPNDYIESRPFDAYVFDRFAPAHAPAGGSLSFGTQTASWLNPMKARVHKPTILRWDETSPLAGGVAWRDLHVERAALARLPLGEAGDGAILIGSDGHGGEGALILASPGTPARVQVGFPLEQSNLYLQPGFPAFVAAAMDWLSTRASVIERPLGSIGVGLRDAGIFEASGARVESLRTDVGTVFQANVPGVFIARARDGELQIAVNRLEQGFPRINRTALAIEQGATRGSRVSSIQSHIEPVTPLILLAFALLLFEWFTYSRRLTV